MEEYGCNSIDIQGGEPTIYPHIFELIAYCREIGLKPTLITNLISLSNPAHAKRFKDAGIYDFLVSLQGIGATYDKVVGRKNAFEKQIAALENLQNLGIPIRVNAVLSNEIIGEIEQIADLAVKYKARAVNFIAYNNTGDQQILRETHKIPYYDLIAQKLEPIVDRLESLDIEVNLRFLPFCVIGEKYRKNIQNGKQMLYDNHEWEASSRLWIDRANQRRANAPIEARRSVYYLSRWKISRIYRAPRIREKLSWLRRLIVPFIPRFRQYAPIPSYQKPVMAKLRAYTPNNTFGRGGGISKVEAFYFEMGEVIRDISPSKIHHAKCQECDAREICDGFYSDFVEVFGSYAIKPISLDSGVAQDARFYSQAQYKVIESEEWEWFFNDDELARIKSTLDSTKATR